MAKKRSESAKEKKEKIPAAARGSRSNKTNGIAKRSSRSSTTRRTPLKGGLKVTNVPSQRAQANRGSCKEESKQLCAGPSLSGKKRNLLTQESSDPPTRKRPKRVSSQELNEENFETKGDDKHCAPRNNRRKAGQTKQSRNRVNKEENLTQQTTTCNQIEETAEKSQGKQKSPLKCIPEVTPESTQASTGNEKNVSKKLKLDLLERVEEQCPAKKEPAETSSGESSDDEGVAWEDVDEAHVADSVLETVHKGDEGASTSGEHHSPSKKSVEISITVPGSKKKKKGWDQEDIMKYVKRVMNRFRKEVFTNVHKVHLLALVAHGMFRNGVCNEPLLQGILLSHVPNDFVPANKRKWDVTRLTSFLKWFQSKFSSIDDAGTGDKETDKQVAKLKNLSEVLVSTLRSLGFLTRLIYSIQAMSLKGDVEGKSNSNNQKKKTPKVSKTNKRTSEEHSWTPTQPKKKKTAVNKNIKMENEVKTPARKSVVLTAENNCDNTELNGEEEDECMKKESGKSRKAGSAAKKSKGKSQIDRGNVEAVVNKTKSGKKSLKKNKRPLRKRKKVDYSLCVSENDIDVDEEWDDQSSDSDSVEESNGTNKTKETSKMKGKTPLARKKMSKGSDSGLPSENSNLSFVDLVDDDSDFEVTSKSLVRRSPPAASSEGRKKAVKIISSDESDDSVKCLGSVSGEQDSNWWAEVYLPVEKKWICLHLESSSVNHPDLCEKQATQPLVYVVSFDNKTSIRDVTNRYASSWMSKTRKLRTDAEWWEHTLQPYKSKNKKMNEMEDSHLEDKLLEKPLPTSITEFKNHPLYVLKRHLLKFEAIYPETAAILGYCRGEAVYSRECVHLLHTREKWLNEALVVKQGEKAYKVVKGRPKRNQPIHERDSVTIDLFGRWQTEKYKPPPAKDGKVPRNEYGNVELFQPCMLPPGTKHIQINGIQRVAKKLGIDCAQAIVGFDFHCGFSHPVTDGVVVCEEFEQILLNAWREEEEQAEKRKAEKREKRMLANWRLLTRSLLIRERLKKRYDTEEPNVAEPSNNDEGEVVTDTSISWPLNRQEGKSSVASDGHCHVFPASGHKQDPITGEWTKSCSCGLTLPFEKM